jgi:hypothetical protein
MKTLKTIFCLSVMLVAIDLCAQEVQIKGSLAELKDMKSVRLVFDYTNLYYGEESESDYIKRQMSAKDADETGTGEIWRENWLKERTDIYEPRFKQLLEELLPDVSAGKDVESAIVMNIHVTYIEAGYYTGTNFAKRPAYVDMTITITKEDRELAVVTLYHSTGVGGMYSGSKRIGEAYAKAAKTLALNIIKTTGSTKKRSAEKQDTSSNKAIGLSIGPSVFYCMAAGGGWGLEFGCPIAGKVKHFGLAFGYNQWKIPEGEQEYFNTSAWQLNLNKVSGVVRYYTGKKPCRGFFTGAMVTHTFGTLKESSANLTGNLSHTSILPEIGGRVVIFKHVYLQFSFALGYSFAGKVKLNEENPVVEPPVVKDILSYNGTAIVGFYF